MTSRLSIFNAYNYFNTKGAQIDLTTEEKEFYSFCCDNHEIICNEDTEDDDPIIVKATKIFCELP